ncbi:MAG: DNA primase [Clostridia bacterium]|nr:DNA primase [Clostridia bacterium]
MAALYPEEVIQEVLSATDIVNLVGSYVHLKRSGRGYMGLCPFHKEKSPSFHVSEDKQLYHCFGCGVGGNAIHFVMAAENLDFVESLKYLADNSGIILPEPNEVSRDKERHDMKKKMYEANLAVAKFYREMLKSDAGSDAREYLAKRKLESGTVAHFGMGYAPDGGALLSFADENGIGKDVLLNLGLIMRTERGNYIERFRNRLMVPIIDIRKNIIGFGGRALSPDEKAKYMNSPESPVFFKGRELFALNYAKNSPDKRIILCEGYMDVISLHQAGYTGAVASMGTALTSEQARTIKKYSSEVYLCYDSDGPGQKATEAAIEIFMPLDIKVKVLSLPEGKDPDEFIKLKGKEAFEGVLKNARVVTEYRISKLKEKYDIKDVEQKVEFTKSAAEVLLKIKNTIEQEAYIKKVSDDTGISEDSIKAEIMKKDASFKKREEKKIFARPVLERKAPEGEVLSGKGYEAEKILLSLMARDKKVYEKYGSEIKADDYSTEALKSLASLIYTALSEGKVPEASVIITMLPSEFSGEASAVFSDDDYGDNLKAASDAFNTIEDERFNVLSKKYIEENNIAKLNELIKKKAEKKRKEGM